MIRFSCPRCGHKMACDDRDAGLLVPCPVCKAQAEAPCLRGRRPPRASGTQRRVVLAVVLAVSLAVPFLACGGVFALLLLPARRQAPNAMCPACHCRFRIPEGLGEWEAHHGRQYRCPRCGESWPAAFLYHE